MNEDCIAQEASPRPKASLIKTAIRAAKYWLYLNVWCRHLYRHSMRFLHRFDLHYAPPSPMDGKYGDHHHWCQWCGMRGKSWHPDPDASILRPVDESKDGGSAS